MGATEKRLEELGLELPPVPAPVGNFIPYKRAGSLLFISGQGARNADGGIRPGRLGKGYTVESASADARQIGLQILATAKSALGSLDGIAAVIRVFGMVNAEPNFKAHPKVIDGCSALLIEVLGERGRHTRSAVGMSSLPSGIAVEIEAILLIGEGY